MSSMWKWWFWSLQQWWWQWRIYGMPRRSGCLLLLLCKYEFLWLIKVIPYHGYFLAQGPQEVTIRQCGARFPEQCITEDSGYFFVTLCSCDTDNCNKDLLCDCPWTGLWQCWCQFRLYLKWLINFIEMPMKSMSALDPTYQTTKMMTQTNLTKSTSLMMIFVQYFLDPREVKWKQSLLRWSFQDLYPLVSIDVV